MIPHKIFTSLLLVFFLSFSYAIAQPSCTTLLSPVSGAIDVAIDASIEWNASLGATGYKLSIGTQAGVYDIENNSDVGNVTIYDPISCFHYSNSIYVLIVPYDVNGDAVGMHRGILYNDCPIKLLTGSYKY